MLTACVVQSPSLEQDAAPPATGPLPDHRAQQRLFSYDIAAPGRSQDEVWHAANVYFTIGMGVNRPKFDKIDPAAGIMEGNGLESWRLEGAGICFTRYALRFTAADAQAHLELEASFGETEGPSGCAEWPILPRPSYEQVVADFNRTAGELRSVLSAGNGASSDRGY